MVNSLLGGVMETLYEEFGDTYSYYTSSVGQNLNCPSFMPIFVNPSVKLIRPPRYQLTLPCKIHYFPLESGNKKEINAVAMRLFNVMEYVKMNGNLVRGLEMEYSIQDDVLIFSIVYKFIAERTKDFDPLMEDLFVTERVK